MISSAECDGPLDDAKVEGIRAELKKLTKEDFYLIRDVSAAMAKEGYDSVRNFLAKVKEEVRKPIEARLVTLDPLIGQLAAIS